MTLPPELLRLRLSRGGIALAILGLLLLAGAAARCCGAGSYHVEGWGLKVRVEIPEGGQAAKQAISDAWLEGLEVEPALESED